MIYVFHDCMVIGFSESSVEEYKDANGNTKAVDINYSLKLAKVRISTMEFANEVVSVKLDESGLTVSFTIEELELKTYFENYREYYYLPEEDCAVHESVAGFMSNRHRKKATAKTAYIKRKDAFIRCPMSAKNLKGILPGESSAYIFRQEFNDTVCYLRTEDFNRLCKELVPAFIHHSLQ